MEAKSKAVEVVEQFFEAINSQNMNEAKSLRASMISQMISQAPMILAISSSYRLL